VSSGGATTAARSRRSRPGLVAALGIAAIIAILLASVVGTVRLVALSPDTLTTAIAPVGTDPQVQAVIADRVSNGVVTALDIEGRVRSRVSGPVGALLAPSIARGLEARLASAISGAMASPQFAARWEQTVRAAATVTVSVLRGDSSAITTSGGVIYLNVLPAIAATLVSLKTQGLIGASVQLPDLSDPSTPAQQVIGRLAAALGISLPPDFGQIAIAETAALQQAQGVVAALDALFVWLVVAAVVLVVAAIALATDRRAAVIGIGIGGALLVGIVPPLLRFADQVVVNAIAPPGASVVTSAFLDAVIAAAAWPLRAVTAACLGVALIVMLADLVMSGVRPATILAPTAIGALAFVAVWAVIGPDVALLGLALVAGGGWIVGRRRLGEGFAGQAAGPEASGAAAGDEA